MKGFFIVCVNFRIGKCHKCERMKNGCNGPIGPYHSEMAALRRAREEWGSLIGFWPIHIVETKIRIVKILSGAIIHRETN